MRHHGLPMASRVIAWKAFVWPHILFYLPFIGLKDVHDVQVAVNNSLRSITHETASPEALAAEFGILPLKHSWAAQVAILGGRLQTNPYPLRAAHVAQTLLHDTTDMQHRCFRSEYKSALHELGLQNHWPLIDPTCLPPLERLEDLQLRDHPSPGAARWAPYRHT